MGAGRAAAWSWLLLGVEGAGVIVMLVAACDGVSRLGDVSGAM